MFEGRLAVVTGGTRGIGRAVAERLRNDGAQVLVTGTKAEGPVPKGCDYRVADFGDEASTEAFAGLLRRRRPQILVNNADVTNPQLFGDVEAREFLRVHRINLVAPLVLSRAVLPPFSDPVPRSLRRHKSNVLNANPCTAQNRLRVWHARSKRSTSSRHWAALRRAPRPLPPVCLMTPLASTSLRGGE